MTDPTRNAKLSYLGPDLTITGNITSSGAVELHGTHTGDIEAVSVVLGTDGKTKGKTSAETIELLGDFNGSISCVDVTLRSSARMNGKVTYETLIVESGATVEGKFKHAGKAAAKP